MSSDRLPLPPFDIHGSGGPFVAVALHAGHAVRPEVAGALALSSSERLREEDPFTDRWTHLGDWEVHALRSRFEVDLNRPRDHAVYVEPADAWGLHVWKEPPDPAMVRRSLETYDDFYDALGGLFRRLEKEYGRFLVFDLHSYNHRRDGADAPAADPEGNPEVNVGTGTMSPGRWAAERSLFMETLRSADVGARKLDVRENVRFRGGHFPTWVHETFPDSGCVLSVEVKKFFMDEWTGVLDPTSFDRIDLALGLGASALRNLWRTGL